MVLVARISLKVVGKKEELTKQGIQIYNSGLGCSRKGYDMNTKKKIFGFATLLSLLIVAGCVQRVDINKYEPVVDLKGQGIAQSKYAADLRDCRKIGAKVQIEYEKQAQKEANSMILAAIIGGAIGAGTGAIVGHQYGQQGFGTAYGATVGATAGTAGAAANADYIGIVARRGPSGVVDECMAGRGYRILSPKGLGGGGS